MRGLASAFVLFATVQLAAAQAPLAVAPGDAEAAKAHFQAGSAYYQQANYADAVKEFTEAFRLSKRTDLLYNIALCYERLDELDLAIGSLKQYLIDRQNASDRALIEARIQNLEKRKADIQQRNTTPPTPPNGTTTPPPAPPATPPPPPVVSQRSFARRHLPSLVTASAGATVLIAALGTGIAADQIHSDLDSKCPAISGVRVCDPSLRGERDQGAALALATQILIGVGAAAIVVGVVLFIIESRKPAAPRPATSWLVMPAQGGLAVRW